MFEYKLSAMETLGVVAVGGALAVIADKFLVHKDKEVPQEEHTMAIAAGAGLYILGVVIGSMRPEGGFGNLLPGGRDED